MGEVLKQLPKVISNSEVILQLRHKIYERDHPIVLSKTTLKFGNIAV